MTLYDISAFGVVHFAKSESSPGIYRPVTQMSPAEREETRSTATHRRVMGQYDRKTSFVRQPGGGYKTVKGKREMPTWGPQASKHSLADVYDNHGYPMRDGTNAERSAKMKQEFDPKGHTPSATHKQIHYGTSVTPQMRSVLDRVIDPKIAGKLKHPVVYHHDPTLTSHAMAAAIPAHQSTGGKGHVVLGSPFTAGYKPPRGKDPKIRRGVVNHELVHANVNKPPEQGKIRALSNIGEESRADHVSGANHYVKAGSVPGRRTTKVISGILGKYPEATAQARRYHEVGGLINAAKKLRKL